MAFNPFHSFRKYQKIWMASILMLCMVTFVLCSGLGQGDLMDRLIWAVKGRSGPKVAEINGNNIYRNQLEDLKIQRQVANTYMRQATEHVLKKLKKSAEAVEKIKNEKKRGEELRKVNGLGIDLSLRLKRPFYFNTGSKTRDLLDFIILRDHADRLNIRLDDKTVRDIIDTMVHGNAIGYGDEEATMVLQKVRESHYGATRDMVIQSLREEFRVRIAELILMGMRPSALSFGGPQGIFLDTPTLTRVALSPAELWDFYRDKVSSFDVALVPVPVEKFLDRIPAPNRAQLDELFVKYQRGKFDPTSDMPGFMAPAVVKVRYVFADPDSDFYKKQSQLVADLAITPPIFPALGLPAFGTAMSYAAGITAFDSILQGRYEAELAHEQPNPFMPRENEYVDLTNPYVTLPLLTGRELPEAARSKVAAAFLAAAAQPEMGLALLGAYQYELYKAHEDEIEFLAAPEARKRAEIYAGLLTSAAPTGGGLGVLDSAAMWWAADRQPQHLPLAVVAKKYRDQHARALASERVREVMRIVKNKLDTPDNREQELSFNWHLRELLKQPYGLEVYPPLPLDKTADEKGMPFRNSYDIASEPMLKHLREAFIASVDTINLVEGRAGTERKLTADDFGKLFFDASEPFSTAAAPLFTPKLWPPVATVPGKKSPFTFAGSEQEEGKEKKVSLWESAEKPMLVVVTAREEASTPDSLDKVYDRVVRAWKIEQARMVAESKDPTKDNALTTARKLAERVRDKVSEGEPALLLMHQEAAKLGVEVIRINNIAPLTISLSGDFRTVTEYVPYKLPSGKIENPREDTSNLLLALNDPKTPLKTDPKKASEDKDLDKINKELIKQDLTKKKQVQLITNRPRTIYYVATVVHNQPQQPLNFTNAYKHALGQQGTLEGPNYFVETAYEQISKEFREQMMVELRRLAREVPPDQKELEAE